MNSNDLINIRRILDELESIGQTELAKGERWMRISPSMALDLITMARLGAEIFSGSRVLGLALPSNTASHNKDTLK